MEPHSQTIHVLLCPLYLKEVHVLIFRSYTVYTKIQPITELQLAYLQEVSRALIKLIAYPEQEGKGRQHVHVQYTSLESGNHYFLTVFLSTACSRPSLCSTSLTCCSEIDQLRNVKSPWALTWWVAPCRDPLSLAAHEHFLCNSWWCWFASADGRSSKLRKKERDMQCMWPHSQTSDSFCSQRVWECTLDV